MQACLKQLPVRIVPLHGLCEPPTVIEDGSSFEANAHKKARALAEFSGLATLADDSGLEVDALGGAPGIHSARYAGKHADDERNNEKLLRAMADVPESMRTARFVCALALFLPKPGTSQAWVKRDACEGLITREPRGAQGFGYDPLFFFPPFGKTFGEISQELKATVSHRGKALRRFVTALPTLIDLRDKP